MKDNKIEIKLDFADHANVNLENISIMVFQE